MLTFAPTLRRPTLRFKTHCCRYTGCLLNALPRPRERCYIHVTGATPPIVKYSVDRPNNRLLFLLLAVYAVASLVHFVHNAEFLGDYPGLPASWSSGGVYLGLGGNDRLSADSARYWYTGRASRSG